ncbi:adult cuticle protein 1 [Drosophila grimshawi]|uniref:GH10481 n=1 Tax=Drosophila grimshawi TaxID=7222 RepID=B4JDV9_DROGR|nr:adult cuticle protein 1 [Drosophila grimshawi]EDW03479.1 GH10481 [Drosophila grimshawi]
MKFVIAVVMFVCAVAGAHASWAAIAPGVSYVNSVAHGAGAPWGGAWNGAWNGGWNGAGAWNGGWNGAWGHGWGAPAAVAVHASAAPWGVSAPGWHGGVPGIALAQGPAGGHEGVYVAKTRGAVHTAPLAGHVNSATSVNLAAAPGTL